MVDGDAIGKIKKMPPESIRNVIQKRADSAMRDPVFVKWRNELSQQVVADLMQFLNGLGEEVLTEDAGSAASATETSSL